ncbi:MAG: hypothetical protein JWM27_2836 [Gemmatimonadetes bacterium]|nr:hypothetical protein [Gemmatimonadota bacterium]
MNISLRLMRGARAPLVAAVLAAAPAAIHAQAARATVRGRVVEAATGNPVAGALVSFPDLRKRAFTDRTGTFTIRDVPVGGQRLEAAQLGFRLAGRVLEVPAADSLTLRLEPDPVVLQGVTAQVDRLEHRRVHATLASRTYDAQQMAVFGHPNPVDFLRNVANLRIAPCNAGELYGGPGGRGDCVNSRGVMERVQVVMDERVERGGIDLLNALPLQAIYRIEVYEGGSLVVVYTKSFMEAMLRMHRELHPINSFRRMTDAAAPGPQPIGGTP